MLCFNIYSSDKIRLSVQRKHSEPMHLKILIYSISVSLIHERPEEKRRTRY